MRRSVSRPAHIPQDYDSLKAAYLALFAETDELFHTARPSVSTCMACPTCGESTRPRYLRDNGTEKAGCLECLSKLAVSNVKLAERAKLNEDAVRLMANKFIDQQRRIVDHLKRASDAEADAERSRTKLCIADRAASRRRAILSLWQDWYTSAVPHVPRCRLEMYTNEELRQG